jgi:hypothetical protein
MSGHIDKRRRRIARDRRVAAIHEASHWLVALLRGFDDAIAIIEPCEEPPTPEYEDYLRTWVGRTEYPKSGRPLTPADQLHISVAGAVGQIIDSGGNWRNREYWISDFMSEDDWRETGCAQGKPDRKFMRAVGRVGDLLSENWLDVCRHARILIRVAKRVQEYRLTDAKQQPTGRGADTVGQHDRS